MIAIMIINLSIIFIFFVSLGMLIKIYITIQI
jgi:hypothetical protein